MNPVKPSAAYWVDHLGLLAHPEGGFYQETYRSEIALTNLPNPPYISGRIASTAIYFLVTADSPSRFHRLESDEVWHFYAGDTLEICCLKADGTLEIKCLGMQVHAGDSLQLVIPAHTWFGARVKDGGAYTLCGCTMSPGFDFSGFELAQRESLIAAFPQHQELIHRLTS